MFIIGLLRQPVVSSLREEPQMLNDFSRLVRSSLILVPDLLPNLMCHVHQARQGACEPWDSLGSNGTANPVPVYNLTDPLIMTDPYHYSEVGAPALADLGVGGSGDRVHRPASRDK